MFLLPFVAIYFIARHYGYHVNWWAVGGWLCTVVLLLWWDWVTYERTKDEDRDY